MKKAILGILMVSVLLGSVSCSHTPLEDSIEYTTAPRSTSVSAESSSGITTTESPNLNEPTLFVTEEYVHEPDALKLTIDGDGRYRFSMAGVYIEDYRYEIRLAGDAYQVFSLPMEAPVTVYIPRRLLLLRDYVDITKVNDANMDYPVKYEVAFDVESLCSEEPITLQDPFLHAVMTDYLGEGYSEKDLFTVKGIDLDYYRWNSETSFGERYSNTITIRDEKNYEVKVYFYSDFFDTPMEEAPMFISDETLEDLRHMKGLLYCQLSDRSFFAKDAEQRERKAILDQYKLDFILGYRVTKDVWSSEVKEKNKNLSS